MGKKIAELCVAANIGKVAFDRGGFTYHGRIKVCVQLFICRCVAFISLLVCCLQAVADAARAGGIVF